MSAIYNNTTFYALLMLCAGIGIPVMATMNAGLGGKLQSPSLAVSVLLVVAFCVSIVCFFIFDGEPKSIYPSSTPLYFYLGGFLFIFYILSITWVAPRFGVGNAIAFVLLGQVLSMALIDHFGLLGANQISLSFQRVVGLLLMAVGIFLAVRK